MANRRLIIQGTALIFNLLPLLVMGQNIIRLNIPSESCSDMDLNITFGTFPTASVVVGNGETTLGRSETIFLPDGVECDGSCSYKSPVTFDAFHDTAKVRSAQDIHFVRLNMEHSYIGDIYINITCPNGKRADLLRFAGSGTSSCDQTIPENSRHWQNGLNMSQATWLGKARATENPDRPCDANASGNEPGIGWNYCWSNNTTEGYTYADNDGLIYRRSHAHVNSVDSSNYHAGKNFYHPDDNFSKLVGCPLNGTWFIEVVDGFSVDNGYIFEWELSLDPSLVPLPECEITGYQIIGGTSEPQNDSTFILHAPQQLQADTSITYTFLVFTSCGDTLDTTATICFHPNTSLDIDTLVCEGDMLRFGTHTISGEGDYTLHLNNSNRCDSVLQVHVEENPRYDLQFYDTICYGLWLTFEDIRYTEDGVYPHHLYTEKGCDSLRTLNLTILSRGLRSRIVAAPQVLDAMATTVQLRNASRGHVSHLWDLGTRTSLEEELTFEYPVEYDSFLVTLQAMSREGCVDTDTVVLRYDRSMFSVPNAFTPTLEENNRWHPVLYDAIDLEVWIYDRAGRRVAHLEGLDDTWDGTTEQGHVAPQGTYVYTLRYHSRVRPEQVQLHTGTVTLIR